MTRALNVDGRKRGTDWRCSRKKSFVCGKRLKLSGHGLQQVVINDMGFLDRYQLFIQQEALNESVFISWEIAGTECKSAEVGYQPINICLFVGSRAPTHTYIWLASIITENTLLIIAYKNIKLSVLNYSSSSRLDCGLFTSSISVISLHPSKTSPSSSRCI